MSITPPMGYLGITHMGDDRIRPSVDNRFTLCDDSRMTKERSDESITHGERIAGAIQAAWDNRVDVTVYDPRCVECRVFDRGDVCVAALTFVVVDETCPYSDDVGAWIAVNTMDDTVMPGDRAWGVDHVTGDVVWAVACVREVIERVDGDDVRHERTMEHTSGMHDAWPDDTCDMCAATESVAVPANLPRIMEARHDAPLRVCVDTPDVIGFELASESNVWHDDTPERAAERSRRIGS